MRTLAEITERLRRTLRRRGQTSEAAEDLVQDAMLKFEIYQQTNPVQDRESFIAKTAFNLAIDANRRLRRSPISTDPVDHWDPGDPTPDPAECLLARRDFERLKAGLAVLDERTRNILLAHRLDGMTYARIAQREGLSQSAVVKRVARGVQFLQAWMDAQ